jgi:tetratricopeptide (TPR) repeat protein
MPIRIAAQNPGICWTGSFFAHHSLALVNRELCLGLLNDPDFARGFDLVADERGARDFDPAAEPRLRPLADRARRAPADASVTVRHQWPPDLRATAGGRLVLCQPWEFGSLPRDWVRAIAAGVDEVWAYTEFVRDTYVQSGIPAAKVRVVPLGIDPGRFHRGVQPFDFGSRPETSSIPGDDFKFLFVGGTIPRKGIDVLLDAFDRTFCAADPVTLIVKDFGAESFYANQGCGLLIRALQAKPGGAKICYLTDDLSESEMASLYAGCDCLVHPYRGEGYGLPLAEAMACGKPTIVTGAGAAMDFATAENAYLIPASRVYLQQNSISGMETVSQPFWLEPDRDALQRLLEHVVNNRAEARLKGARAAADIAAGHTWADAARAALPRLTELAADASTVGITSYSLPMGLANFGLAGLNGVELPEDTENARYEDRKQAALTETRSSDWPQAIGSLEACLRDRPADWDALNALGVAKFRDGDRDEALAILRRGAAESPNPRDFHHNLAFVLLAGDEASDTLEAIDHAISALRCSPADPNIRRTLERARTQALQSARKLLRAAGPAARMRARRDERYRSLMDGYRRADAALGEPDGAELADNASQVNAPARPRISLVMIVKNEERFLRSCLISARELADEIVVVDTGSTDSTIAIASEFGAKVVRHAWSDDFSEARNVSLAHATGDWALWLDADEEIAPGSVPAFRAAVGGAGADIGGFMVEFRNWLGPAAKRDESDMAVHHACRLFRLAPGVRFEGRIHEQNLRSLQNLGFKYGHAPGLTIDHFGYSDEIMTARNKHDRFIRMLMREVDECPDPSLKHFHLFNLGNAYFTRGDMANAVTFLRRAAEQPDLKEEFTATLFTELATALQQLGRSEEGLEACAQADRLGMRQAGVEFARAYCQLHLLRYAEAEQSFRSAVRIGLAAAQHERTGDRGTSTYKAHYGLALALVGQERYDEARGACEEAIAAQTGFVEARYLLAVTLTRLGYKQDAVSALEGLLDRAPGHEDGTRELGVLLYELGDYSAAAPRLEAAQRARPDSVDIAARLADCYERMGRLDLARSAYQRLLALAPDSAEVRVNMGRTLAAAGSEAEALASFVRAIELDRGYANAYFNAGDLLYKMGQYSRAAETYMSGLQVSPAHPSGFFVLANCFFQTGDYAAAAASYEQQLALNPDHEQARHNLALVESERSLSAAA